MCESYIYLTGIVNLVNCTCVIDYYRKISENSETNEIAFIILIAFLSRRSNRLNNKPEYLNFNCSNTYFY